MVSGVFSRASSLSVSILAFSLSACSPSGKVSLSDLSVSLGSLPNIVVPSGSLLSTGGSVPCISGSFPTISAQYSSVIKTGELETINLAGQALGSEVSYFFRIRSEGESLANPTGLNCTELSQFSTATFNSSYFNPHYYLTDLDETIEFFLFLMIESPEGSISFTQMMEITALGHKDGLPFAVRRVAESREGTSVALGNDGESYETSRSMTTAASGASSHKKTYLTKRSDDGVLVKEIEVVVPQELTQLIEGTQYSQMHNVHLSVQYFHAQDEIYVVFLQTNDHAPSEYFYILKYSSELEFLDGQGYETLGSEFTGLDNIRVRDTEIDVNGNIYVLLNSDDGWTQRSSLVRVNSDLFPAVLWRRDLSDDFFFALVDLYVEEDCDAYPDSCVYASGYTSGPKGIVYRLDSQTGNGGIMYYTTLGMITAAAALDGKVFASVETINGSRLVQLGASNTTIGQVGVLYHQAHEITVSGDDLILRGAYTVTKARRISDPENPGEDGGVEVVWRNIYDFSDDLLLTGLDSHDGEIRVGGRFAGLFDHQTYAYTIGEPYSHPDEVVIHFGSELSYFWNPMLIRYRSDDGYILMDN